MVRRPDADRAGDRDSLLAVGLGKGRSDDRQQRVGGRSCQDKPREPSDGASGRDTDLRATEAESIRSLEAPAGSLPG